VVSPQNHSDGFRQFDVKTDGDGFWRFGLKTSCDCFRRFGLKTGGDGFRWFGLKTSGEVFSSLASKLVVTVSPSLASKPLVGFSVEPQNQGGGGFPGLGLKTGISDLVIWASKSPRRFLGLGLKTDGGRSAWDTCHDLAACLAWKQVWLGFPSLG
jgi:hypothetical protein